MLRGAEGVTGDVRKGHNLIADGCEHKYHLAKAMLGSALAWLGQCSIEFSLRYNFVIFTLHGFEGGGLVFYVFQHFLKFD